MMKNKRTRREVVLDEMERAVPWSRLLTVIAPLYPRGGRVGRQPIGVSRMLRMYCLQQWQGLADEAPEDALHDKKGNAWHFGMKAHIGVDASSGLVDAAGPQKAIEPEAQMVRVARASRTVESKHPG